MKLAEAFSGLKPAWYSAFALATAVLALPRWGPGVGWGASMSAQEQHEGAASRPAPADAQKPDAAGPAGRNKTLTDEEIRALLSVPGPDGFRAAMRKLEVRGAVPGLAKVLRDSKRPENVRRRAARLLGRIATREAKEVLIEVLARTRAPSITFEPGAEFYGTLRSSLYDCFQRQPVKQLMEDLHHDNAHARWLATRQLGERKCAAAVPELICRLDDSHDSVRAAATSALGEIADPRGIEELIAIVERRRISGNRFAAVKALGRIATPRCMDVLNAIPPDDRCYMAVLRTPPKVAEAMKTRAASFKVVLQWLSAWWEKTPRNPSFVLSVSEYKAPPGWEVVRISEKQAIRIIDHLYGEGFFHDRTRSPGPPQWPRDGQSQYYVEISVSGGPWFPQRPPWNRDFRRWLRSIRTALDGEADEAMDKLLRQMRPGRGMSRSQLDRAMSAARKAQQTSKKPLPKAAPQPGDRGGA